MAAATHNPLGRPEVLWAEVVILSVWQYYGNDSYGDGYALFPVMQVSFKSRSEIGWGELLQSLPQLDKMSSVFSHGFSSTVLPTVPGHQPQNPSTHDMVRDSPADGADQHLSMPYCHKTQQKKKTGCVFTRRKMSLIIFIKTAYWTEYLNGWHSNVMFPEAINHKHIFIRIISGALWLGRALQVSTPKHFRDSLIVWRGVSSSLSLSPCTCLLLIWYGCRFTQQKAHTQQDYCDLLTQWPKKQKKKQKKTAT